ncbi:hypothetical protein A4H97_27900 [Niastella yeongjuensis]|uniref:DUF2851 domain-containing protein n=1 Tax=Niastella yeongjuensis TaxID=354355 RepID=A0A1V9EU96_9BACT|nr:DUF2851 family protein [Niastella yeongjuensis]OQP49720.1 hypothetical protein A4H97_27900 [Niastella yeongjuensis]SEP40877.1 Protein of unknown function [Niastella yeongjuensis]
MNERLLQYLWQFQYYNKQSSILDNGDTFQVIHPGRFNTNQGPDFLEAKIRIEDTLWVGHVEVHVKTSDWFRHAHQFDRNYDNVVLHVVWEHDLPERDTRIPVFSMQSKVPLLLLEQYRYWMNSAGFIACGNQVREVSAITWISWRDRLLAERIQRKSTLVFSFLLQTNQHWEETFWWLLARNFGAVLNFEPFEAMAKTLPVTVLARCRNQLPVLEALLFGQCGLLEGEFEEEYPLLLQREYLHAKNKYQLQPVRQSLHFLRTRPVNFPTIRLAQLATLLYQSSHLFAFIKDTEQLSDVKQWLSVTASEFWDSHYTLQKTSCNRPKRLGNQMIDTLIINTVIPVLFAYGLLHNEEQYKNRALNWLDELEPEMNAITHCFSELGIVNKSACDSQALLELKGHYCDAKKCLDCAIGNALLKRSVTVYMETYA